ncbi:hypothetical protein DL768_005020 [Monosporascus sp. mg162]|nr:hypothetical protein DL768_005020 [Monosporascus sp. mg162]
MSQLIPLSSPSSATILLSGPFLGMMLMISCSASAAAIHRHNNNGPQPNGQTGLARSNFDNIRRDEVNILKPAQDSAELAGAPAPGLGRAGGGGEGGVEVVDVKGEVDLVRGTDVDDDFSYDARAADAVDLARSGDPEAALPVVLGVAGPTERRADASVHVAVVSEQALARRVVEVRPAVDAGGLRGQAAEDLGSPCVTRERGRW